MTDDKKTLHEPFIQAEASETWTDTFYDKEKDVVAVFDLDFEQLRGSISRRMLFVVVMLTLYITVLVGLNANADPGILIYVFFFSFIILRIIKSTSYQKEQVQKGLHVCVTEQGIRRDLNRFPIGSMFRTTFIIPFDEIRDIKTHNSCSCCTRSLAKTVIVTAKIDGTAHMIPGVLKADEMVELVEKFMRESTLKVV